jgi:molybdate transport system substrate-binding protein
VRTALVPVVIVAIVAAIGWTVAGRASPAAPEGIRVAAASDLQFAFDELIEDFEAANPGRSVVPTYGSSGTFFSQISNGAPFDVYFSADVDYPRRLEAAGLVEPGGTRSYAIGRLALWVPDGSTIDVAGLGMAALLDPRARRIAIANPEHAPYGRAAVAAMESAGVHAAVRDGLVLGENVSQAAQFVESGAADIGIVALSLVRSPTLAGVGTFAEVPADLHPPIEQGAAVLARTRDPAAAGAFLAHVLSPGARPVLDRYGFTVPDA